MKLKDKELLLKDLSARLPYRVKAQVGNLKHPYEMVGMHSEWAIISTETGDDYYDISKLKPYLRPISSMTDKERKELHSLLLALQPSPYDYTKEVTAVTIDFYYSKHFDWRDLIKKGLALEALEGMYK